MKKLLVLCVLLGACALAWGADKALDRDGNLYVLAPSTINDTPVLQMRVFFASGLKTFMTVPGSEGPETEASPQVYLSSNAKKLYISYERRGTASSEVLLTAYDLGGGFSDSVVVSEAPGSTFCVNPRLYQTYEASVDESGNKSILQFIHMIWWEDGSLPGAVYLNIPVVFGSPDLSGRTLIRLGDIVAPGSAPADFSALSPNLYQTPSLFVPQINQNSLYVFFADLASMQYQTLQFRYNIDSGTLRDRAHFPDIGVRAPVGIPVMFSPSSGVNPILGFDGRLGLFSMEPGGTLYTVYCQGWTSPLRLPLNLNDLEVGSLLNNLLNDLQ